MHMLYLCRTCESICLGSVVQIIFYWEYRRQVLAPKGWNVLRTISALRIISILHADLLHLAFEMAPSKYDMEDS
jgi:hypothetical protein